MGLTGMDAHDLPIEQLLDVRAQYVVPQYQRLYSWKKKQWEDLWKDLLEVMDNEGSRHFIGSIVTIPVRSAKINRLLLIDGQQRLTTMLVLLAAIRNHVDSQLAGRITEDILTNRHEQGLESLKLLPTKSDQEIFLAIVRNKPADNTCQLGKAHEYFSSCVQRALEEYPPDTLFWTLLKSFVVVHIVLGEADNPHLVYETLNFRGEDLQEADLIRNYFFMQIGIDRQDEMYQEYWEPIERYFNNDSKSLSEYVRDFLIMKTGKPVSEKEVYQTLRKVCDDKDEDGIISYVEEMKLFAGLYSNLIKPEIEPDKDLASSLSRWKKLRIGQAYPFLLRAYHDYATGKMSKQDIISILGTLETFIVRRMFCRIPTNRLKRIFPSLYSLAHSAYGSIVDGIKAILREKEFPSAETFRREFVTFRLYSTGSETARLILESLESRLAGKERVDSSNLTIEHVMPQVLTDWWKAHLGTNSDEVHKKYQHTIGNLTLTAFNPEMQNFDFPTKKKFLVGKVELNKSFADLDQWSETEIIERGKSLAAIAAQVWPDLGQAGDTQLISEDEVVNTIPSAFRLCGQRIPATKWREVAYKTAQNIYSLVDKKTFDNVISSCSATIGRDKTKFREPKELSDGIYVDLHLSAKGAFLFCKKAVEAAGLAVTDWTIELKENQPE